MLKLLFLDTYRQHPVFDTIHLLSLLKITLYVKNHPERAKELDRRAETGVAMANMEPSSGAAAAQRTSRVSLGTRTTTNVRREPSGTV